MDVIIANQQDATSDYGSDFSSDEEVILNSLLQQHHVPSDPELDLLLADIGNDETSHTAKIPFRRPSHRIRSESGTPVWKFHANKRKLSIEIEGYESSSSPRKPCPTKYGID